MKNIDIETTLWIKYGHTVKYGAPYPNLNGIWLKIEKGLFTLTAPESVEMTRKQLEEVIDVLKSFIPYVCDNETNEQSNKDSNYED
jgi:hypothetical protein